VNNGYKELRRFVAHLETKDRIDEDFMALPLKRMVSLTWRVVRQRLAEKLGGGKRS
jgi:hypothetical protein